jgi:hypothetical protein
LTSEKATIFLRSARRDSMRDSRHIEGGWRRGFCGEETWSQMGLKMVIIQDYPWLSMDSIGLSKIWIIQDYPIDISPNSIGLSKIIHDYPHFAPFWIAIWEVILTNHVYTGIWVINDPWLESISEMGVSSPVISWFMTPLNLRYIYNYIYIYTP